MTRPVRVLCLLSSLIAGGAERQMLLILQHLDRQRFEPTLGVLSREGPLSQAVPPDVPILSFDKRSRWDAPRLVLRLVSLLRRTRPDVVLAKVDYTNWVAAAAARIARTGVPLVLGEESLQSDALALVDHTTLRKALLRGAYGRAACVTAPSAGVINDLKDGIGVGAREFVVIPNMVDISAVAEAAQAAVPLPFEDGSCPLLTAVGRLAPGKGQDDLIRAVALLRDRRRCNLLLVGSGVEEGRLRTLAAELRVEDQIAFLGFAANPFAIMARADVLVSPSHSESFGNVLIEAMAVGVPVVSTDLPHGPASIVRDGSNAVLCRARDPHDLAAKVAGLLENPSQARTLVEQAKLDVRVYDVTRVVPEYESLLLRVAGHAAA